MVTKSVKRLAHYFTQKGESVAEVRQPEGGEQEIKGESVAEVGGEQEIRKGSAYSSIHTQNQNIELATRILSRKCRKRSRTPLTRQAPPVCRLIKERPP